MVNFKIKGSVFTPNVLQFEKFELLIYECSELEENLLTGETKSTKAKDKYDVRLYEAPFKPHQGIYSSGDKSLLRMIRHALSPTDDIERLSKCILVELMKAKLNE